MTGAWQSAAAAWLRLPPNLRGILWITIGTILFALNDVVIKTLGRTIHPFELAFFRYTTGMIFLSPIFVRVGVDHLRTRRLWIHMLRLVMATTAQVGVLVSVINMPLANVTALAFSRILFTTLVAVLLLKELVTRQRWIATFIGFVGVLVIVRPGAEGIDPIALIALASALTFAIANVMIRMMSTTEPPVRIMFYYHAGGTLIFVLPALWVWTWPVGWDWLLIAAIGALTTLGMAVYIRGFSVGEASVIGPMEYVRLIYAAILGYVIFSEVPDALTLVGALTIVGATSYIARLEAKAGSKKAAIPDATPR